MIETARLLLRRWRRADAAPFHAMGQDAEVMRYLGPPVPFADCAAAVRRQNAIADRHGRCFWAVERREDGAFLGFCGVEPGVPGSPLDGVLEISWRFAREAWGHGYAHEAAAACLAAEWARGSAEVVAVTVPANARSWRLMRRLGMTRDPAGDFNHPQLAPGDPLRRHLTYRIACPA